jgi:signal transduction histidine kinase
MPSKAIELEIKKNIYLLYKEAINNVVKHANASQVSIQFKYKFKKLKITIADDGKGFDLNKITKGNGLDSMQNRIKQVNGKIEFIPNQPQGTIVIFELKI